MTEYVYVVEPYGSELIKRYTVVKETECFFMVTGNWRSRIAKGSNVSRDPAVIRAYLQDRLTSAIRQTRKKLEMLEADLIKAQEWDCESSLEATS